MLIQLQTLKFEPLSRQAAILTELADRNLDMSEQITHLCKENRGGHMLRFCSGQEARDVVRLALVTLAYADIGTVPYRELRNRFLADLQSASSQIGVDWNDVIQMHAFLAGDLAALIDKHSTK